MIPPPRLQASDREPNTYAMGYHTHMNIVAIIPAKGTSIRLPGKNIRPMLGKPLIAWSIEAARASRNISRVIVSTDDEGVANVAREYGAEVPFMEPRDISAGGGSVERVLLHAADWLQEHEGYAADALVLLLPTNPLRQPEHLDAMVEQFEKTGADCTASVCEAAATHNPYWMFMRDSSGNIITATGSKLRDMPARSQDLPPCYIRNDIGFVLRPDNLRQNPAVLWGDKVDLYAMDEIFDTDINTQEDWNVTEDKLRRLRGAAGE